MNINLTNSQINLITSCLERIQSQNEFDIESSGIVVADHDNKVKIMKSENLKIQRLLDKFLAEQLKGFDLYNSNRG
tara:strand:- start:844 stop:1071 length:228 start_codon:yes stop_codon:yes gene_type:complete